MGARLNSWPLQGSQQTTQLREFTLVQGVREVSLPVIGDGLDLAHVARLAELVAAIGINVDVAATVGDHHPSSIHGRKTSS